MTHLKFGHITLSGILVGLVWMGVGFVVDHEKEQERLREYNRRIRTAVESIDPFHLSSEFSYRVNCGITGECLDCPTSSTRILKIDCGRPEPFNFKDLLQNGVPAQTERPKSYWLGLLSDRQRHCTRSSRPGPADGWSSCWPSARLCWRLQSSGSRKKYHGFSDSSWCGFSPR